MNLKIKSESSCGRNSVRWCTNLRRLKFQFTLGGSLWNCNTAKAPQCQHLIVLGNRRWVAWMGLRDVWHAQPYRHIIQSPDFKVPSVPKRTHVIGRWTRTGLSTGTLTCTRGGAPLPPTTSLDAACNNAMPPLLFPCCVQSGSRSGVAR